MSKPDKWCEPCGRVRPHRHEKCPYCGGVLLAQRPAEVAGAAPCSAIPFEDNKGHVMQLDGKLTIADLVKMGVKEIRLMPEGSPLPDNWWRDARSPNEKGQP